MPVPKHTTGHQELAWAIIEDSEGTDPVTQAYAAELKEVRSERKALKSELRAMRAAWELERRRSSDLEGQIESLRNFAERKAAHDAARETEALTDRIESMEIELGFFQSEATRMQARVVEQEQQNAGLRQHIGEARKQLQAEAALRSQLAAELAETHEELAHIDQRLRGQHQSELAMGRQMIDSLVRECERYEKGIGELRAEKARLEGLVKELLALRARRP